MFEVISSDPPDTRFIEYRLGERSYFGLTTPRGDHVLIESGSPVHVHELVHAVHFVAWPTGPDFLEEGLAILLGGNGLIQDAGPDRPTGALLDEELSAPALSLDYGLAWLVVSQIVLEHGMSGLRTFWFEVGARPSMTDVRDTYTRLFGGSLDQLTQPFDGVVDGEVLSFPRGVCWIRACTGVPLEWTGGTVSASGVSSCGDEHAVSPSLVADQAWPWRDFVLEGGYPNVAETAEGVYVETEPCGILECDHVTVRDAGLVDPPEEAWEREGRYRARVYTNPEELPPGDEPSFTLVQQ